MALLMDRLTETSTTSSTTSSKTSSTTTSIEAVKALSKEGAMAPPTETSTAAINGDSGIVGRVYAAVNIGFDSNIEGGRQNGHV